MMKRSVGREPRVAQLEAGFERLIEDMHEVRAQGASIQNELKLLNVGLTQAKAPRETNWQTLIAAGGLLMVLGAAVLWPMNMKMAYMEKHAEDQTELANRDLDLLNKKLQRETELIADRLNSQSANNTKEVQNLGDRIVSRVNDYDRSMAEATTRDLEELRWWRLKSMGACTPSPQALKP
jgi:hypothetical protein